MVSVNKFVADDNFVGVFVVERIRVAALFENYFYFEGKRDSFFQFFDCFDAEPLKPMRLS